MKSAAGCYNIALQENQEDQQNMRPSLTQERENVASISVQIIVTLLSLIGISITESNI
jgi:hypothetical protein